jgi:hypothetical protein
VGRGERKMMNMEIRAWSFFEIKSGEESWWGGAVYYRSFRERRVLVTTEKMLKTGGDERRN